MRSCHDFDITVIKREQNWDFYECIRLINYVRRNSSNFKCFYCHFCAKDSSDLSKHFVETRHDSCIPDKSMWDNSLYLFPTYDSDPLLMHPDLMDELTI